MRLPFLLSTITCYNPPSITPVTLPFSLSERHTIHIAIFSTNYFLISLQFIYPYVCSPHMLIIFSVHCILDCTHAETLRYFNIIFMWTKSSDEDGGDDDILYFL